MAVALVLLLAVVFADATTDKTSKHKNLNGGEKMCKQLMKDTNFEYDMVIGRPWRIYYSWNINMGKLTCIDILFKNATRLIKERIMEEIYEYIEDRPDSQAPGLLATVSNSGREMLLIDDRGPPGFFVGVPNVLRTIHEDVDMHLMPLFKFFLKFIHKGKFILLADCRMGIINLMARPENVPYKQEIAAINAELHFEEGFASCATDQHKDEKSDTMYVISQLKDIPKQNVLYEEAAKLGYRRRGGKSYLNQGKSWKPMFSEF